MNEVVEARLVVVPSPGLILAWLPKLLLPFEAGSCLRLPIVNEELAEVEKGGKERVTMAGKEKC